MGPNYIWENGVKQIQIIEENVLQNCILCQLLRIKIPAFFSFFFFCMNIVDTNKYNKKLQSPGALNIKETPGYKQKDNVKKQW